MKATLRALPPPPYPLFGWSRRLEPRRSARSRLGVSWERPRAACVQRGVTERVGGWWGGVAVGFQTGQWTVSAKVRGAACPRRWRPVLDRDVGEVS